MNGKPLDPLYQRAMEFAKNHKRTNGNTGISNLYVLQLKDLDGKVVSEHYGMNMLTDYGMSQYFVNTNGFPTNIYIGNGSGTFNYETNTLLSTAIDIPSTISVNSRDYNYPLYYDKVSGLITCTTRYIVAYFDYNINGVEGPLTISEYGIGTGPAALWTHAWVYDNLGRQSTITKDTNQRLEITVFFCMSFHESLIENAWNEGRHIIITNMARFFENRMYESSIQTFKRDGSYCSRDKNRTRSVFQNHVITQVTNMNNTTLVSGNTDDKGYIDGFANWHTGMNMMERVKLNHDVPFDAITVPQYTHRTDDNCLAYNIGHNDYLPFTDLKELESYTYNFKTGQFDCRDSIEYDPEVWYNDTPMTVSYPTTLRYTNNNTVMTVYVYRNMRTDDPIVAFKGGIQTVYATDKYWDCSTWVMITDPTNVPENVRNAKFWITTSNTVDIQPVRSRKELTYTCKDGKSSQPMFFSNVKNGFYQQLSNPEHGYFMIDNEIYDLDHDYSITTVGTTGFGYTFSLCYEKNIATFNSGSPNVWITDMSQPNPTPQAIANEASIANLINCYITETKTGFILLKDMNSGSNKLMKLDLRNGTYSQSALPDCLTACAITMTDKYAYVDVDSPTTIHICSLDNMHGSVTQDVTLPGEITTNPNIMFGYRNLLYVGDTSTYLYVIDLNDNSVRACTMYTNKKLAGKSVRIEVLNDCMIVYDSTKSSTEYALLVTYDQPDVVMDLSPIFTGSSGNSNSIYRLQYLNDNTIVLIYQSYFYSYSTAYLHTLIMDFGKYIHDGDASNINWTGAHASATMLVPYGDRVVGGKNVLFQLAHLVPHRLKGKTRTVTTYDSTKSIQNKSWSITFTNVPLYNGLPPGNPQ